MLCTTISIDFNRKFHSLYVKESESEILERSELESKILPRLRNPAGRAWSVGRITWNPSLASQSTTSVCHTSAVPAVSISIRSETRRLLLKVGWGIKQWYNFYDVTKASHHQ